MTLRLLATAVLLVAVASADFSELWLRKLKGTVVPPPAHNVKIMVGSAVSVVVRSDSILGFNTATGKPMWISGASGNSSNPALVKGSVAVHDPYLLVTGSIPSLNNGYFVLCIDARTGKKVWSVPVTNPHSLRVNTGSAIYESLHNAEQITVDFREIATGKLQFQTTIPTYTNLEPFTVGFGIIVTQDDNFNLVGYNEHGGNAQWTSGYSFDDGSVLMDMARNRFLVLGDTANGYQVVSIDPSFGGTYWSQNFSGYVKAIDPIITPTSHTVFVGLYPVNDNSTAVLMAIDCSNGNIIWAQNYTNTSVSDMVYAGGALLVYSLTPIPYGMSYVIMELGQGGSLISQSSMGEYNLATVPASLAVASAPKSGTYYVAWDAHAEPGATEGLGFIGLYSFSP